MLGMGLSLVPEDFQRVGKYPKAVAIGLISQLLILPLIGLAIAKLLPMQPAIATGLMILALCPGGVSSNLVTFLAMGDVALSVTLTALSSLITVFTIPIFANLASQHFFWARCSSGVANWNDYWANFCNYLLTNSDWHEYSAICAKTVYKTRKGN